MMVSDFTDGLGNRISEAAKLAGGKRALSHKTGIKESTLYRYINGKNMPSTEASVRIAAAVNVDINWLLTGKHPGETLQKPRCPFLPYEQHPFAPLGDLLHFAKELRNILDKQERQIISARRLLKIIVAIAEKSGGDEK